MKLLAISDLHVDYAVNMCAVKKCPAYLDAGLIIAGDISHDINKFTDCLTILSNKFDKIFWVPGNHDLWSIGSATLRGVDKYLACVECCRKFSILTPEDNFFSFSFNKQPFCIACCFLGYDYSFRPDHVLLEDAIAWALEDKISCADEKYLYSTPYPSKVAWCNDRVMITENKLDKCKHKNIILVNHYPLTEDTVFMPRVPRFSIWSGTKQTESWLQKYSFHSVVFGHCHVRREYTRNNTKCFEVSFGYPSQQYWGSNLSDYFVPILI